MGIQVYVLERQRLFLLSRDFKSRFFFSCLFVLLFLYFQRVYLITNFYNCFLLYAALKYVDGKEEGVLKEKKNRDKIPKPCYTLYATQRSPFYIGLDFGALNTNNIGDSTPIYMI